MSCALGGSEDTAWLGRCNGSPLGGVWVDWHITVVHSLLYHHFCVNSLPMAVVDDSYFLLPLFVFCPGLLRFL